MEVGYSYSGITCGFEFLEKFELIGILEILYDFRKVLEIFGTIVMILYDMICTLNKNVFCDDARLMLSLKMIDRNGDKA